MNILLDPIEARVIGSLMEKSLTTPEQYPLSLNALVAACNQRTSREPVMDLAEAEVQGVLDRLKARYLVREKSGFGSRVPRYHYRLYNDEIGEFRFSDGERAVVCLLLLRGPQTAAELRTRSARLHEFADVEAVEQTLAQLAAYEQGPFVTRLAREPGRREARWAERFTAGEAAVERHPESTPRPVGADQRPPAPAAPAAPAVQVDDDPEVGDDREADSDRLTRLEQRVAVLEAALEALLAGRLGR
jgi:uncharacterized protein